MGGHLSKTDMNFCSRAVGLDLWPLLPSLDRTWILLMVLDSIVTGPKTSLFLKDYPPLNERNCYHDRVRLHKCEKLLMMEGLTNLTRSILDRKRVCFWKIAPHHRWETAITINGGSSFKNGHEFLFKSSSPSQLDPYWVENVSVFERLPPITGEKLLSLLMGGHLSKTDTKAKSEFKNLPPRAALTNCWQAGEKLLSLLMGGHLPKMRSN